MLVMRTDQGSHKRIGIARHQTIACQKGPLISNKPEAAPIPLKNHERDDQRNSKGNRWSEIARIAAAHPHS